MRRCKSKLTLTDFVLFFPISWGGGGLNACSIGFFTGQVRSDLLALNFKRTNFKVLNFLTSPETGELKNRSVLELFIYSSTAQDTRETAEALTPFEQAT